MRFIKTYIYLFFLNHREKNLGHLSNNWGLLTLNYNEPEGREGGGVLLKKNEIRGIERRGRRMIAPSYN